jgi:hypothetical protein
VTVPKPPIAHGYAPAGMLRIDVRTYRMAPSVRTRQKRFFVPQPHGLMLRFDPDVIPDVSLDVEIVEIDVPQYRAVENIDVLTDALLSCRDV